MVSYLKKAMTLKGEKLNKTGVAAWVHQKLPNLQNPVGKRRYGRKATSLSLA